MIRALKKTLAEQPGALVARLFTAWCLASAALLFFSDKDFLALEFSKAGTVSMFLLWFVFACVLLTAAAVFAPAVEIAAVPGSVLLYGVLLMKTLYNNDWFYLLVGILLVLAGAVWYAVKAAGAREGLGVRDVKPRAVLIAAIAMGACTAAYIGTMTVLRVKTYSSPNFDFGLFVQMFHNMRETLAPMVTSERDMLLSHFAVHISPIYYLMLPFYAIFPYAETLQICQAILLGSGVVPLYFLCRKIGLSGKMTLVFSFMYACYPAMIGGCFYDLHENKFLFPLLLWLFYFVERRGKVGTAVFALLVCLVKEDAPIYVAFLGLYLFFARKERRRGAVLFAGAIAYFSAAIAWLGTYGNGVMTGRYENFAADGSLITVVKNVLLEPGRVIYESMTADKLIFLALMVLPLGLLPFAFGKKLSRMLLLAPLILVNMMPDYQYQHTIDFQYTYGSGAFLFYLSALNARDLSAAAKRTLATLGVCAGVLIGTARLPQHTWYVDAYRDNRETYDEITEVLAMIPDDASVIASTMFVQEVADRSVLYEVAYTKHEAEYVAIDMRYTDGKIYVEKYKEKGYEVIEERPRAITLLYNPSYVPEGE